MRNSSYAPRIEEACAQALKFIEHLYFESGPSAYLVCSDCAAGVLPMHAGRRGVCGKAHWWRPNT